MPLCVPSCIRDECQRLARTSRCRAPRFLWRPLRNCDADIVLVAHSSRLRVAQNSASRARYEHFGAALTDQISGAWHYVTATGAATTKQHTAERSDQTTEEA